MGGNGGVFFWGGVAFQKIDKISSSLLISTIKCTADKLQVTLQLVMKEQRLLKRFD